MATLHTPHLQLNSVIPTSYTHRLVFIDTAVEDYESLVNGVIPHTEVFVIDPTHNGVEQITEILATHTDQNISSIHLVCHGVPGSLQLGNTHLGLDTLEYHSQQLQQWQKIFSASPKTDEQLVTSATTSVANLLIYGCNVADGDVGGEFIAKLHQLTGANIAASCQLIGSAALGGNWELSGSTTDMEVNLAFTETTRKAYAGVLATFAVNNTGDADDGDRNNGITTLREAINLANATAGNDTITFGGVFTNAAPDTITLTSGQLTITDDVTILGTGTSNLTVRGNNASTIFEISGLATDVTIDGLAIASGDITVNKNSILSLTNSNVSGNTRKSGIYNSGILSLTGSSVFGNTKSGIYNSGILSLTGSTLSNNNAISQLNVRFAGSVLSPSYGGGIYNSGTVNLTNSTVSGSTAESGGGIFNSGIFNLSNSTISGNNAYNEGGGIFNKLNSTAIVGNTIIAGNFNDYDGFYYYHPQTPIPKLDVSGDFTDLGNNLIGDNTGSTGFTTSTLVGTSANPIDPKLSPLQNNGGATFTHALLGDSPAINAGNNALIRAGITTDQRGAGFDRISQGKVDIGALEFNGVNGTNGADNLVGNSYNDIIDAQGGNDTITGNQGNDILNGGSGNDTITGNQGNDILNGGGGNDTITGNEGNDILTGGGGNDKFVYNLGDGVDTITDFSGLGKGSNASAAIIAELDTLKFQGTGLTAQNLLLTQNGKNLEITFEGVADNKIILQNFPQENLDNLSTIGNILFDGQNTISKSFDVFDADSTESTISNKNIVTFLNDLNNNVNGFDNSADVINGQGGDDRIDGKNGNDLLRGGTGDDTLIGGAGNDILLGGGNSDTLIGGAGNDILIGGEDYDTLTGGSGNDQFIYQTLGGVGDTITDFNQSEDKLVLTDLFKSLGYSSSNPISDRKLKFVQSDTSTRVQVLGDSSFQTLVTLNNFTATNLVVGSNVIV